MDESGKTLGEERRRSRRVPFDSTIFFKKSSHVMPEPQERTGQTEDISQEGLSFVTQNLNPGELLVNEFLLIRLPITYGEVFAKMLADVRWIQTWVDGSKRWKVGMRFVIT